MDWWFWSSVVRAISAVMMVLFYVPHNKYIKYTPTVSPVSYCLFSNLSDKGEIEQHGACVSR